MNDLHKTASALDIEEQRIIEQAKRNKRRVAAWRRKPGYISILSRFNRQVEKCFGRV